MKSTIYPNLYSTVQNAMPMLSGNTNLKLHMNFHEYYPTSTKYLDKIKQNSPLLNTY